MPRPRLLPINNTSFDRRQFSQLALAGCGGLPVTTVLGAESHRTGVLAARAKSCILLYMDGGPSQLDMWDMKPDAPAEIRGPFQPIATSVPGLQICEHLPLVARQMHLATLVRSVCHQAVVHDPAVYQMLTGYKHVSSAGNLTVQPDDHPHMAAALARVDRTPALMPKAIELPETMKMSARTLPGQNAGYLGATYDPFRVEVTPEAEVMKPVFALPPEIAPTRYARWKSLVGEINRQTSGRLSKAELESFDEYQRQAMDLVATPGMQEAFDIEREPTAIRDRYGRNRHGQSVLLARRLAEAGARFVTVYWGKEVQDWANGKPAQLANNPWDTHRNHFPLVKDSLVPRADRALAALLADLHERGTLDETLVIWMGDFGRTPRINKQFASRDHWPQAFSLILAGAGLPGGAIYGRTDQHAATVVEDPVSPADLTATIFTLLGVDPRSPVRGPEGKLMPISAGKPLAKLLG
jgi:hypothetical protein